MTPLEAVATPQSFRSGTVLMLTAGGKNPDVLGAFRRIMAREPHKLVILCAKVGSPLGRLAARHPSVEFAEFEPPAGKDGFLATNSLLASAIVLLRAYSATCSLPRSLPATLQELVGHSIGTRTYQDLRRRCRPLWECQTLLVLHGPATQPAAIDLESKFSEAALGAVQVADFRNFAHGRHHWLAKRGGDTGILAFVTDNDRDLAESLLKLIPAPIPVVRINAAGEGVYACLAALVQVFLLTGCAGEARGIDPGDPQVPAFGRRIYHLRAFRVDRAGGQAFPAMQDAAIERKSGLTIATLRVRGELDAWRSAYRDFVDRLTCGMYKAIVLDYDGTLCDASERFGPLPTAVNRELSRLLRAGVIIGVATGRGQSARKGIRAALDQRLWERVVVGYYNGGDIGILTEDDRPDGADRVDDSLARVADAFRSDPFFARATLLTFRGPQITVEPKGNALSDDVWARLLQRLHTVSAPGVTALRSSHSMDIVAPRVCKKTVIERVSRVAGLSADEPILCIGDRGRWPGNDFSLLSGPHSLSVDEVSSDASSCWNLASPGRRGSVATADYLRRLKPSGPGVRLRID